MAVEGFFGVSVFLGEEKEKFSKFLLYLLRSRRELMQEERDYSKALGTGDEYFKTFGADSK